MLIASVRPVTRNGGGRTHGIGEADGGQLSSRSVAGTAFAAVVAGGASVTGRLQIQTPSPTYRQLCDGGMRMRIARVSSSRPPSSRKLSTPAASSKAQRISEGSAGAAGGLFSAAVQPGAGPQPVG